MAHGSPSAIVWAIVVILVAAWLLGWLYIPSLGFLIHLVLVLAIIVIIVNLLGLLGGLGHHHEDVHEHHE